jgi:hypothetical protein
VAFDVNPAVAPEERDALAVALAQLLETRENPWLRAGRAEATGVDGEEDVWPPLYALSPRMTRGATRA